MQFFFFCAGKVCYSCSRKELIDYGYFGDYLGFADVGDWNLL